MGLNSLKTLMKYTALLLCVLLLACKETDLDLSIPYAGDKLVLWGKLKAGSSVRIQLTRTFRPSGELPEKITVSNAIIVLFRNGNKYVTLSESDKEEGVYLSDSLIRAGETYIVQASAHTLPLAESLPVLVPADLPDVTIQRTLGVQGQINHDSPQDLLSLYFSAKDQGQERYFSFLFLSYFEKDTVTAGAYGSADNIPAQEEDCHTWSTEKIPSFYEVNGKTYQHVANVFLMNSKCLPSPNTPLDFFIHKDPRGTPPAPPIHTILKIGVVTKEAFDYAKIEYDQPEGVDLLVLPPQRALTNIKNGYGLIFASNEKVIEIP